jgi:predicted DCC family thiol-disulfide oxidoreductase YuxK
MAVWMIFAQLSWPWKFISFARIIPLSISDFFYVLVARYRYLLLGKRVTCRLPDEIERQRFLS